MTYIRRLIRNKMTYENQIRVNKMKKKDIERTIRILEIIKRHGKIHNNLLKKELHKSLGTGTKTFDRLLKEMSENGILVKTGIKNKIYYSQKFNFNNHENILRQNIKFDVMIAREDLILLISGFEKFDLFNKSAHTLFTLNRYFRTLEKIVVFNAIYENDDMEKRELRIKLYLKEIFKIIKNDDDGQIILTLIKNNLFPKSYRYEINEFAISS